MLVGRPVLDNRNQVQVGIRKIHFHVLLNLSLRQFREAVKVFESVVDEAENLLAHSALENLLFRQRANLQIVAFHNHFRDFHHLFRHLLGHENLEFHVVVVLLPTAEFLDVFGVVGVVVDGCHRAEFVETEREHSLGVEIGESERTDDFFHPFLTSKIGHGVEQRTAHVEVVDEVDPTEANALALPFFVGLVVHNRCHATHYFPVFVGEEIFRFAKLERGIFVAAQRL